MAKQIGTVENSPQAILRGVNILADAVKITSVGIPTREKPHLTSTTCQVYSATIGHREGPRSIPKASPFAQ
jgi:hypothetical protein